MKREIKFRGLKNKTWRYGYYNHEYKSDIHEIINDDDTGISVLKKSIGQYTGLKDKNGIEIYEGDIIRFIYNETERKEVIEFRGFAFTVGLAFNFYLYYLVSKNIDLEVIGNIHENK